MPDHRQPIFPTNEAVPPGSKTHLIAVCFVTIEGESPGFLFGNRTDNQPPKSIQLVRGSFYLQFAIEGELGF